MCEASNGQDVDDVNDHLLDLANKAESQRPPAVREQNKDYMRMKALASCLEPK